MRIILALVAVLVSPTAAAQPNAGYIRLFAQCVPVLAWAKDAEANGMTPTVTRVDGDGDVWTFWEKGKLWWLTMTQDGGATICPIARSKDAQGA